MTKEPLFWCVWQDGGGSPTVKHNAFYIAKAEAQRLARENPGRRFVVLAAAMAFHTPQLTEVRFMDEAVMADLDEIPF